MKNIIVPFIKLKSVEKNRILLEYVVSITTANNVLKGELVTKGK